ncbi:MULTISPECIES: TonB-dependent receptor [Asticcacaulis]|uniref:TonB-dependent receptor n=1 Tax=Asticcacaulis TaxID=76890 RepID=UPI001AE56F73|nr:MULTISPECIES: TonB-dependent receptor [Asticcacaulis]MBP2160437.1 TonB-dependent receptor [Asticcacaulis solisilvae]MDR6801482.1 TonB-dependent receptor [Asticcacaulis sp. BE141]
MKTNLVAIRAFGSFCALAPLMMAASPSAQAAAPTAEASEPVVIQGYRDGRDRSLNQKKKQTNISDRVSADAIGNLPDRNVAEAIARVPGVSLSLEQGEGRYISIRGIDPNLNQVQVDGATAAAPGGSRLGRAVPLDTLGLAQISQIEVIKSVTPDLDANSLGGTLSIKTVSPFSRPEGLISAQVAANHSGSTGTTGPEVRLTFSDVLGASQKWGIAAALSFEERDYANHWVQSAGWEQRTVNGITTYLPGSFEIKPEEGNLRRLGGNIALEYRPDDSLRLFLRGNYSTTRRVEHTVETVFNVSNSAANVQLDTATTGVFRAAGVRPERRDFRVRKDQQLLVLSTGFEKVAGDFTFESLVTWSAAKEETPYNNVLAFRAGTGATGPIAFDIGAFDFVRWEADYTQDTASDYPLRRTREDFGLVDETTATAKFDVTWAPSGWASHDAYIKAGVKHTRRDRAVDMESRRYIPVGNWRLSQIGVLPAESAYDDRYSAGFVLDHDATFAYIKANPALVSFDVLESARNSIEDDYDIDETISAAYVLGTATFGRLTILGGLRWEGTEATIRAVEARFDKGVFLGHFPASGATTYDRIFPNLQGVFRITDDLQLRAAVTRTIGRPAYEDARPLSNFTYETLGASALNPTFGYTGTLSIGNPDLKPFDAHNLDVSLDWYTSNRGLVSIAAFRKEIDDPIYGYSDTRTNTTHNGIGLETLRVTSTRNADQATIDGVELNIYQPFSFLPAPFDGLGIDANLTVISSDVTVPTRPGEAFSFFRQPDQIQNVTLFYEKGNVSGRVAWNHTGEQLYTLGSNIRNDEYRRPRSQVDALLRYMLSPKYALTVSARNLTKEPEQFSYGIKSLIRTSRLIDQDVTVSISAAF